MGGERLGMMSHIIDKCLSIV